MGWVNDLKWAVKGALGSKKKTPLKNPAAAAPAKPVKPIETRAEKTVGGLKNAGLSQDEIDRLAGKKKKAGP